MFHIKYEIQRALSRPAWAWFSMKQ